MGFASTLSECILSELCIKSVYYQAPVGLSKQPQDEDVIVLISKTMTVANNRIIDGSCTSSLQPIIVGQSFIVFCSLILNDIVHVPSL